MGSALRVWHNGVDWWVAADREHLRRVIREATRMDLEDDDMKGDGWSEWPDGKSICITDDETGTRERLTPSEWAARSGPGFLCSREY